MKIKKRLVAVFVGVWLYIVAFGVVTNIMDPRINLTALGMTFPDLLEHHVKANFLMTLWFAIVPSFMRFLVLRRPVKSLTSAALAFIASGYLASFMWFVNTGQPFYMGWVITTGLLYMHLEIMTYVKPKAPPSDQVHEA